MTPVVAVVFIEPSVELPVEFVVLVAVAVSLPVDPTVVTSAIVIAVRASRAQAAVSLALLDASTTVDDDDPSGWVVDPAVPGVRSITVDDSAISVVSRSAGDRARAVGPASNYSAVPDSAHIARPIAIVAGTWATLGHCGRRNRERSNDSKNVRSSHADLRGWTGQEIRTLDADRRTFAHAVKLLRNNALRDGREMSRSDACPHRETNTSAH